VAEETTAPATAPVSEMIRNDPDPQPGYLELLRQGHVLALDGGGKVAVSRAAVDEMLKHPEVYSSDQRVGDGLGPRMVPLNVDPPEHVKYRRLLDPLFAPKRMDAMEERIAARANQFIDAFIDRGECEYHDEFAVPFPCSIFVELMGLPWEDLDILLGFKDAFLHPAPDATPESMFASVEGVNEYFSAKLDERERQPTDDILSHFLTIEIDGEKLTRDDILGACLLFILAGLDTVTDALSTSYRFLAEHQDYRRQIVEDPSIIPSAVEELLRWETVVPSQPRRVTQDTELLGCPLKAGDVVMYNMGSANVDPDEYPDPLAVRFDRDVNRHLTFGGGVHRCLGSHLARRELRVAFREWHRRIPEYRIKPGTELQFPQGLRTVQNLVLTWPTSK
jgi:cytochrome P450